MQPVSSLDGTQPSKRSRWRWFTQWPGAAQVALTLAVLASGSALAGPYRWVQGPIAILFIGWLTLEMLFSPDDPRLQTWSRRRRVLVTGLLILVFVFVVVYSLFYGF